MEYVFTQDVPCNLEPTYLHSVALIYTVTSSFPGSFHAAFVASYHGVFHIKWNILYVHVI
jgi:hypothetical protein